MNCFNLKIVYFAISGVITSIVLIGGFTIIIKNSNQSNYDWAQNLIAMCVTLWMPSPADSIKEIIKLREVQHAKSESLHARTLSLNNLKRNKSEKDIEMGYSSDSTPQNYFPARNNSMPTKIDASLVTDSSQHLDDIHVGGNNCIEINTVGKDNKPVTVQIELTD